jgi:hypothetical protein
VRSRFVARLRVKQLIIDRFDVRPFSARMASAPAIELEGVDRAGVLDRCRLGTASALCKP